ncbi:DNA methyltransferase [uncultured Microbacterium sp.]|uniref:DNA methyltransferase n=1 Tax=uncultured Microbacterium sp. TaxID=191216 RepID=UPI0028DCF4CF|nr:DNA methyltransferase [uncultured Microbacterium sp.]
MNAIRNRAAKFALDWKDSPGDEKQDAQSFVRDLLGVYGITETRAAFYEKRVKRTSTGRRGYIDALIPGRAAIEMKSRGEDLAAAERQALDYLDSLSDTEMPRWVISCDFSTFRILDLHAHDADPVEFGLEELRDNADSMAFFAGYGGHQFGSKEQEAASIKAAKLMASLYEALEQSGYEGHEASVFLVRTLFALYADDSGVWERDLFLEFLETRTAEDGSDLGPQLSLLYQVMGKEKRQKNLDELVSRFPYVNGGVFEDPLDIPSFDAVMRQRLLDAARFNWSAISPAIFGSLFQAVKDKTARRQLGEHYTTETNILKVIRPMFLDDLRRRFDEGFNDAKALTKLRARMGQMRFLDPACGCGNFLIIAFREMRALDLEILQRLQQLGGAGVTLLFAEEDLPVRLENFHGIELEEWPAQIASTALHLVQHQANMAMELALGQAPDTLPLDRIHTIHVGNALQKDWSEVVPPGDEVYVVGNPPFIGMNRMTSDQQADNRLTFSSIDAKGLRTGRLDYVACWYAKAISYLKGTSGRAAFVSTNSITQGEQARTMLPLLSRHGFAVDFAHRTFKWTSEAPGAAAVHCIVVGFSASSRSGRGARLFTYDALAGDPTELPVARVNFYLADGPDVVPAKLAKPATPGMPNGHKGSQPTDGGYLIIDDGDDLAALLADPHAAPYIRRFIQGKDMLQGQPKRWCLWLKDANPSDIAASPLIKARLAAVRAERKKSPTQSVVDYADRPALFTQNRQPSGGYFALPEVSSSNRRWIPGRFIEDGSVAGNKLIIFPDARMWQAALLQSSMFMAWVETFAGRLKSDISISPALAYFPVPWPTVSDNQREVLAEGWKSIVAARDLFPDATLADLYDIDAMPHQLLSAHAALDSVVDKLFGARRKLADNAERLSILLKRYDEANSSGQLAMPAAKARSSRN